MMKDILANLNDKQKEAVTVRLGPVLVLAGAGSGKTRVLIYRIAYLLQKKLFKPEDILALTFTNKAAGEMKERIQKLTANSYKLSAPLTMGTFHAVCAKILRHEIHNLELGYSRNFVIYDAGDAAGLVKQIVLEKGVAEKYRPQLFSYYISQAKNRLVGPADLRLDNPYLEELLQEVYEEYQGRLEAANAVDFDDLLRLVYELFSKRPEVLKAYQEKFKYVLVDEYQDTNHVQYMILKLLVKKHRNLFVVGDDAQSIYGFRGANMQNILDFKKDYARAKVIMLEQNYRSTQGILDVAHSVIKMNPFQYEKKLWTENSGGAKVSLYEARDEMDEARFVLKRITNHESRITEQVQEPVYVAEEDTPILDRFKIRKFPTVILNTRYVIPQNLSDFVVLYRTHAQSRPIEETLLSAGVPYQIIGGIKFYERKEIKDVLAFLRLVNNPRDLVSFSRVINLPTRGIGPATLRTLNAALAKYDYNYERLHLNLEGLELSDKALAGAKDFLGLYLGFKELPENANLLEIMELLLLRSGYKQSLQKQGEEGLSTLENIEELFNVAGKFSAKGGSASGGKNLSWRDGIDALLEEVALMTDLDSVEESENRLTLMTLHSAKGLEFDQVFFVGLEEGLLPHSRSLMNPQELAEEIRLAYVGITRARKDLYLSYARQRMIYGELKRSVPSRIIKAIPKGLLQRLN